jgi:hypothetical protein
MRGDGDGRGVPYLQALAHVIVPAVLGVCASPLCTYDAAL